MEKVLIYIALSLVILFFQFSVSSAQSWQELMDSSKYYQEKQDYQTALQWAFQAETKAKTEFGEMDTNYASTLRSISELFYYQGNIDSAMYYGDINLKLCRTIFRSDHTNLATSINNMAFFYGGIGNYHDAEPLYKEAIAMLRRIYNGDHLDLANSMINMAVLYNSRGDIKKAEPLMEEALEMNRRIFKGDHPDLARSINNMAVFYHNKGNIKEAEPLYKEALEMKRRIFKGDHRDLANSINNMADFYKRMGDFKEAEPLFKEALGMSRRIFKDDHPFLAHSINIMASFYNNKGDFKEAEPLYKEALEMRRRIFKGGHPDLASSINNMAYFYFDIGDFKEAELLFKEALEMNRRIFKVDHPDLARSIKSMSIFYESMGDFKEAEPLCKESLEMSRRIFKDDHPELAISINNMAHFYDGRGDFKEAELLHKEALEMSRRIFKVDHPDLAIYINTMANIYQRRSNFKEAEPLFKESLGMSRRIYKDDHPLLAHSINIMASFYNNKGDFKEAEPLYKEALEMRRRIYITEHPDLANSINGIANYYKIRGDVVKAEPFFIEAIDIYQNIINNNFPSLSEKERKLFWNTMSGVFEGFNSFAIRRSESNPLILCNMYDVQLYTKGMLLSSTNRIKNRIMNSGDSALVAQFHKWSEMKEFLVRLYKMTNNELKKKNFNIDSIENVANDMEKQLSLKSEDFKLAYDKKKINWRLIQGLLKPNEAAVEVLRFRKQGKIPNKYNPDVMINDFTDTIHYAFLIITNDTEEHPDLVLLENGNELENDFYNNYREHIKDRTIDNESFTRYWGALNKKLQGYKKIYFSADGIYNKLNPATLIMPDGRYILDLYDIQQVNSTKDILLGFYRKQEESNIYNNAVLVGNPNFSLTEEQVREVNKKLRGEQEEEKIYEQLALVRGMLLTNLPGTEKEIKSIEKFLKSKKWDVKSYLGDLAIKGAVQSVRSPRILHIATHGLFLEDVERGGQEIFGFEEKKMVENPLLRSGLFFTGADNYIKKGEGYISDNENGILTAYEAMNLDLDKTELVVLSACETGLGDIQNGEGVFGLRRAFQQAGAKTIIMSLWAVSDEATQELMSNFYSNWVSGMTKGDAFNKAQQEVRKKYPAPYYWGAFVMVGE